ncbi:hypothetical protein DPX16_17242 [Anabarilius grahami]|uniref:Uncharacterized protein n=1 Tax=Anabarilius grahami TaxID=495550 RepID=A0A3N0YC16_ANAGA|nr:hypothetical protein DPX16_17242 [Anabarilius grahami]
MLTCLLLALWAVDRGQHGLLTIATAMHCITAFDELQADFKVPIDQGNPLHAILKKTINSSVDITIGIGIIIDDVIDKINLIYQ